MAVESGSKGVGQGADVQAPTKRLHEGCPLYGGVWMGAGPATLAGVQCQGHRTGRPEQAQGTPTPKDQGKKALPRGSNPSS